MKWIGAHDQLSQDDYEPDVLFSGTSKAGLIDKDTLKFPIPDLIATVAQSVELHRLEGKACPTAEKQTEGALSSDEDVNL